MLALACIEHGSIAVAYVDGGQSSKTADSSYTLDDQAQQDIWQFSQRRQGWCRVVVVFT